jgi:UDP-2,3-diacylglucosamine hydrolase
MPQPRTDETLAPKTREAAKIAGPLGIIAGRGPLPCVLAELAASRGLVLHIVGIRGETREDIERFPHTWTRWGELGKLLAALNDNGCRDIVIIGGVDRPDFAKMRFDFGAIRNLPYIVSLRKGGDDHVLSRIVRFFEGKGYRVHGADDVAPELLAGEGALGNKAPSAEDRADIDMAFEVVRALGRFDVGQGAVVAKGHVLAVEAAEGTDAMLVRCAELRRLGRAGRGGRAGVLVKAPKPGQEQRVDLPTIGPETLKKAAEAGLAGVAVAAGRVLMTEPAATVKAANELGLFLLGEPLADRTDDA